MDLEKREDGYWIADIPESPDCGPYHSKADAESDRRGMDRFAKYQDRPDFVTVDPPDPPHDRNTTEHNSKKKASDRPELATC